MLLRPCAVLLLLLLRLCAPSLAPPAIDNVFQQYEIVTSASACSPGSLSAPGGGAVAVPPGLARAAAAASGAGQLGEWGAVDVAAALGGWVGGSLPAALTTLRAAGYQLGAAGASAAGGVDVASAASLWAGWRGSAAAAAAAAPLQGLASAPAGSGTLATRVGGREGVVLVAQLWLARRQAGGAPSLPVQRALLAGPASLFFPTGSGDTRPGGAGRFLTDNASTSNPYAGVGITGIDASVLGVAWTLVGVPGPSAPPPPASARSPHTVQWNTSSLLAALPGGMLLPGYLYTVSARASLRASLALSYSGAAGGVVGGSGSSSDSPLSQQPSTTPAAAAGRRGRRLREELQQQAQGPRLLANSSVSGSASHSPSLSVPRSRTPSPTVSRTGTGTVSPTRCSTGSRSRSPSPTVSRSLTTFSTGSRTRTTFSTGSRTLSVPHTPTNARSRSVSSTISRSTSVSPTSMPCPSISVTQSASSAGTLTFVLSASMCLSAPPSATSSPCGSRSSTPSLSTSGSISGSPSSLHCPSATVTATKSFMPSSTISLSATVTITKSFMPSSTLSRSSSPSSSPSISSTSFISKCSSVTITATKSLKLSISHSLSASPSVTLSQSTSPSRTRSVTSSPPITRSSSCSGSTTRSSFPSPSPSKSARPSLSPSTSPSPSKSARPSLSPSTSPSHTVSSSQSPSPSRTRSATSSPRITRSTSCSGSTTSSPFPSPSPSNSAQPSVSPSASPSPSSSAEPSLTTSPSVSLSTSASVSSSRTSSRSPSTSASGSPQKTLTLSRTSTQVLSSKQTSTLSLTSSGTRSARNTLSSLRTTSITRSISVSQCGSATLSDSISSAATSSLIPSLTSSPSLCLSSSPSDSHSPSFTSSPSGSLTLCSTATFSPLASRTASVSRCLSASPSNSHSPSFTRSTSRSPTGSPSPSRCSSGTPSPSISRSTSSTLTTSGSHTLSPSVSSCITATFSASPTVSHCPTVTSTNSISATLSTTATHSPSPSPCTSVSLSGSRSPSGTVTPSLSVSDSPSPCMSTTATPSSSVSPSISATTCKTPSACSSVSLTSSVTASVSPSLTHSFTASVSHTPSTSASPSISPSVSRCPSASPTSSLTVSVTGSLTLSTSSTPSATQSPSSCGCATSSISGTRTVSNTAPKSHTSSFSATPCSTASYSATVSTSRSSSASGLPSRSPSCTSSPSPSKESRSASTSASFSSSASSSSRATRSTSHTRPPSNTPSPTGCPSVSSWRGAAGGSSASPFVTPTVSRSSVHSRTPTRCQKATPTQHDPTTSAVAFTASASTSWDASPSSITSASAAAGEGSASSSPSPSSSLNTIRGRGGGTGTPSASGLSYSMSFSGTLSPWAGTQSSSSSPSPGAALAAAGTGTGSPSIALSPTLSVSGCASISSTQTPSETSSPENFFSPISSDSAQASVTADPTISGFTVTNRASARSTPSLMTRSASSTATPRRPTGSATQTITAPAQPSINSLVSVSALSQATATALNVITTSPHASASTSTSARETRSVSQSSSSSGTPSGITASNTPTVSFSSTPAPSRVAAAFVPSITFMAVQARPAYSPYLYIALPPINGTLRVNATGLLDSASCAPALSPVTVSSSTWLDGDGGTVQGAPLVDALQALAYLATALPALTDTTLTSAFTALANFNGLAVAQSNLLPLQPCATSAARARLSSAAWAAPDAAGMASPAAQARLAAPAWLLQLYAAQAALVQPTSDCTSLATVASCGTVCSAGDGAVTEMIGAFVAARSSSSVQWPPQRAPAFLYSFRAGSGVSGAAAAAAALDGVTNPTFWLGSPLALPGPASNISALFPAPSAATSTSSSTVTFFLYAWDPRGGVAVATLSLCAIPLAPPAYTSSQTFFTTLLAATTTSQSASDPINTLLLVQASLSAFVQAPAGGNASTSTTTSPGAITAADAQARASLADIVTSAATSLAMLTSPKGSAVVSALLSNSTAALAALTPAQISALSTDPTTPLSDAAVGSAMSTLQQLAATPEQLTATLATSLLQSASSLMALALPFSVLVQRTIGAVAGASTAGSSGSGNGTASAPTEVPTPPAFIADSAFPILASALAFQSSLLPPVDLQGRRSLLTSPASAAAAAAINVSNSSAPLAATSNERLFLSQLDGFVSIMATAGLRNTPPGTLFTFVKARDGAISVQANQASNSISGSEGSGDGGITSGVPENCTQGGILTLTLARTLPATPQAPLSGTVLGRCVKAQLAAAALTASAPSDLSLIEFAASLVPLTAGTGSYLYPAKGTLAAALPPNLLWQLPPSGPPPSASYTLPLGYLSLSSSAQFAGIAKAVTVVHSDLLPNSPPTSNQVRLALQSAAGSSATSAVASYSLLLPVVPPNASSIYVREAALPPYTYTFTCPDTVALAAALGGHFGGSSNGSSSSAAGGRAALPANMPALQTYRDGSGTQYPLLLPIVGLSWVAYYVAEAPLIMGWDAPLTTSPLLLPFSADTYMGANWAPASFKVYTGALGTNSEGYLYATNMSVQGFPQGVAAIRGVQDALLTFQVECGVLLGRRNVSCGPGVAGRSLTYTCPGLELQLSCLAWDAAAAQWSASSGCTATRVGSSGLAVCSCNTSTAPAGSTGTSAASPTAITQLLSMHTATLALETQDVFAVIPLRYGPPRRPFPLSGTLLLSIAAALYGLSLLYFAGLEEAGAREFHGALLLDPEVATLVALHEASTGGAFLLDSVIDGGSGVGGWGVRSPKQAWLELSPASAQAADAFAAGPRTRYPLGRGPRAGAPISLMQPDKSARPTPGHLQLQPPMALPALPLKRPPLHSLLDAAVGVCVREAWAGQRLLPGVLGPSAITTVAPLAAARALMGKGGTLTAVAAEASTLRSKQEAEEKDMLGLKNIVAKLLDGGAWMPLPPPAATTTTTTTTSKPSSGEAATGTGSARGCCSSSARLRLRLVCHTWQARLLFTHPLLGLVWRYDPRQPRALRATILLALCLGTFGLCAAGCTAFANNGPAAQPNPWRPSEKLFLPVPLWGCALVGALAALLLLPVAAVFQAMCMGVRGVGGRAAFAARYPLLELEMHTRSWAAAALARLTLSQLKRELRHLFARTLGAAAHSIDFPLPLPGAPLPAEPLHSDAMAAADGLAAVPDKLGVLQHRAAFAPVDLSPITSGMAGLTLEELGWVPPPQWLLAPTPTCLGRGAAARAATVLARARFSRRVVNEQRASILADIEAQKREAAAWAVRRLLPGAAAERDMLQGLPQSHLDREVRAAAAAAAAAAAGSRGAAAAVGCLGCRVHRAELAVAPALLALLALLVAPAGAYAMLFTSNVADYVVWAALTAFGIAFSLYLAVLHPLCELLHVLHALVLWPALEPTLRYALSWALHSPRHLSQVALTSTLEGITLTQALAAANHLHPSAALLALGDLGFVARALHGPYRHTLPVGVGATRVLLTKQRLLLAKLALAEEREEGAGKAYAGARPILALSIRNPLSQAGGWLK